MHKIKLKIRDNNTQEITDNFKDLNFHFGSITEDGKNIKIIFYSQYQLERFLNITNLQKYHIETFIENFNTEDENRYKIGFFFFFSKEHLNFVNERLKNYLYISKAK